MLNKNLNAGYFQDLNLKKYCILLSLITFIVFGNTLLNGYNFDDDLVTINHPLTSQGLKSVYKIFTSPYYTNNVDISFEYRPITHLTFAIEHQFLGESPTISHFINLLLYVLCIINYFIFTVNWLGRKNVFWAFLTALIFTVHPIHTEVVASIKNRDELLSFLFLILSFNQLNKFALTKNWLNIILSILLFTIGLLAKKSIYPLIFVLPLCLIYINKINTKTTFIITVLMSVFAGIAASNFNINKIIILTLTPILFTLFLIAFVHREKLYLWFLANVWYRHQELILITGSLIFTTLSIYHHDYIWFVLSALISLFYLVRFNFKNHAVLIFVTQLTIAGYFLQLLILIKIAFVLSCVAYLPIFKSRKFNYYSISILIPAVVLLLMGSFIYSHISLMVFILLGIFFTSRKNIFTALVLLNITASFLFFNLNYFHLIFAILLLALWLKELKYFNKLRFEPILILLLIPIIFFIHTPITGTKNFIDTFISNQARITNQQQISITSIKNPIEIGRGLSYIENTLIGNQTAEAILTTGVVTIGEYIKLLVAPYELSFYYGYSKTKTSSLTDIWFWLWFIAILLSLLYLITKFRQNKLVLISAFAFALCIVLFSNTIELVAGMVGERLAFTASAFFILLIVLVLMHYKTSLNLIKPGILEYGLILFVLLFSTRTIIRNSNWENPLVLMANDIKHLNESAYANNMYALTCMNVATTDNSLNQQDKITLITNAEQSFKKSISIYPNYFNAQFDLARLYILQQNFKDAKIYLDNALALDSKNPFVLEELAKTCFDLNLSEETIQYAITYLNQFPENENMYEILAYTLFKQADYNKAKFYAERGLALYPESKNLTYLLADINKNID